MEGKGKKVKGKVKEKGRDGGSAKKNAFLLIYNMLVLFQNSKKHHDVKKHKLFQSIRVGQPMI